MYTTVYGSWLIVAGCFAGASTITSVRDDCSTCGAVKESISPLKNPVKKLVAADDTLPDEYDEYEPDGPENVFCVTLGDETVSELPPEGLPVGNDGPACAGAVTTGFPKLLVGSGVGVGVGVGSGVGDGFSGVAGVVGPAGVGEEEGAGAGAAGAGPAGTGCAGADGFGAAGDVAEPPPAVPALPAGFCKSLKSFPTPVQSIFAPPGTDTPGVEAAGVEACASCDS